MCTLSVLRLTDHTVITMNRDEARSRHEAGIKRQHQGKQQQLYPVDGQAGGSWFGINNHGVVLALLNRYQDPQRSEAPTRGQIIPQALAYGSAISVSQHLAAQDYQLYNPFDLVFIAATISQHFSWNGQQLTLTNLDQSAFQFSSSAINTEQVLSSRKQRFDQWLQHTLSASAASVLQKIHLQQCQKNRQHSVLMDRHDAHSKSICQVLLGANTSQFDYYPEQSLQAWREQLHQPQQTASLASLSKQQHLFQLINPALIDEVSS
ncbi:NRDE family protein [Agarivorans sp. MS3-6]